MGKLTYYEKTTQLKDKPEQAKISTCLANGESGLCYGGNLGGCGVKGLIIKPS
jgi:hypothetical protein